MNGEEIFYKVQKIIQRAGSRNPFDIADFLGIMLNTNTEFKRLSGIYTIIKRKRVIILNGNLEKDRLKIVLAHELGHDILHRDLAKNRAIIETMVFDLSARPEYEANIFASELLISDNEVLELVNVYGYDLEHSARLLNTDINLLSIKIENMNRRGYTFNNLEYNNNFLRD